MVSVYSSKLGPQLKEHRPFWLNPRQVIVVPVTAVYKDYAVKVAQTFSDAGIFAEADLSDNTLNKKIRNGQLAQCNFIMGTSHPFSRHGDVTVSLTRL